MRILKLAGYYEPEQVAGSHLVKDLSDAYRQVGFSELVYAPTPTRGVDNATRRDCCKRRKHEVLENGRVEVFRFSMFREGRNPLQRAFRYACCVLRQTICGLKAKDCDVLMVTSTPPINGLMMAVLHRHKDYKIVYNLQDIFPDSMVYAGMTHEGSFLWKIGRRIEAIAYRSADKILTISDGFKHNLMAKGVPEDKIAVIPNWVDENEVQYVERAKNPLFERYGLERDKFYICYSGNVGHTQNMPLLVEVAQRLQGRTDIGIVVVGDGAYRPQLEALTAEKGVKNITLLPFQDYRDISYVFSLGDVGLLISKKGIGTHSVPSKTWSIMSASRPVLASFDEDSELCGMMREIGCGVCVPPDDAGALTAAILSLSENRTQNETMGARGRQYIEKNLTKELCTAKYVQLLREVTGGTEPLKTQP